MMTRKILFGLAIALLATTTLVAQDDDKKAKKALDRAKKTVTASMMKYFAKAELTDDQKTQATAVIEKHAESHVEARKAQDGLFTEEQLAKKKASWEKSKADGVKGKAATAAAFEAMGLSEAEKAAYDEARKKVSSINAAMRNEITALLTDEQKAAMPQKKGKGKGKKKDMKKEAEGAAQAVSLKLPNMTWGGCARSVRTALTAVDGIADIKTNPGDNTCSFKAPEGMDVEATLNKIVEGGNKHIKGWALGE